MVETDFSGDFLNAENTQEGDIAEIVGEGEYKELEKAGVKKKILNLPVQVNGANKIWSPFAEDGKKFQKAYGKDTKSWVGKKGTISHVKYKSFGETKTTISIEPLIEEKI